MTPPLERLGNELTGALVTPNHPAYSNLRQVNNRAIDRHPACIALCVNVRDVQLAIDFARSWGLPVAVRSGGHSYAGHGVCENGVVIDLSPMKRIEVDKAAKRVRIESGVLSGELERAIEPFGVAVPLGTCPLVGVAGYALGGGESVYSPKLGYACDNILSMEVITADGKLLEIGDQYYADLFWAMRGAGANFGIATSIAFQLHDVNDVLSGELRYPFKDARGALKFINSFARAIPPELFLGISILSDRCGKTLKVKVVWNGPKKEGENILEPLRRDTKPVADSICWKSYFDEQRSSYETPAADYASHRRAGHFNSLSDELIDTVIEHASQSEHEADGINLMHWHGPWTSSNNNNAFGFRTAGFEFWVHSSWQDAGERETSWQWVERIYGALKPFSSGAVYLNDLEDEGAERVRAAYGSNYDRLAEIKWKYDRQNFFRINHNIRPTVPVVDKTN